MRRVQTGSHHVFVDTNAFGALAVDGDAHHQEARAIAGELAGSRVRLVTTNYVIAETHALILARAGRGPALLMLNRIDRSMDRVIWVNEDDVESARSIIERYDDKSFSLTDATSFVVMERVGLPECLRSIGTLPSTGSSSPGGVDRMNPSTARCRADDGVGGSNST